MQKINVRETRQHIGQLLDAVVAGEEFIITRRNKPVARLSRISEGDIDLLSFPNRADFRARLPKCKVAAAQLIRELRDERG